MGKKAKKKKKKKDIGDCFLSQPLNDNIDVLFGGEKRRFISCWLRGQMTGQTHTQLDNVGHKKDDTYCKERSI